MACIAPKSLEESGCEDYIYTVYKTAINGETN